MSSEIADNIIVINVTDHSVSKEGFRLIYDKRHDMLVTDPQPNIDQLPKYYKSEDYISHTDKKRNLLEIIYHLVRSFALKKKLKLINTVSKSSKSLLDIGCGTGDFLKIAENNGWAVCGIEPNEQAREIASSKIKNNVFTDINTLPEKASNFDVITLWHVLEHLPNLEETIKIIKARINKNGTLIVAVPNYKSYDAEYYKSFWAAYDVPRHLWHFSRESIKSLFRKQNMDVIQILPMKFDSYYVSLLSEKYKEGFSLNGIYRGWKSNYKARTSGEYSSLIYVIKQG